MSAIKRASAGLVAAAAAADAGPAGDVDAAGLFADELGRPAGWLPDDDDDDEPDDDEGLPPAVPTGPVAAVGFGGRVDAPRP